MYVIRMYVVCIRPPQLIMPSETKLSLIQATPDTIYEPWSIVFWSNAKRQYIIEYLTTVDINKMAAWHFPKNVQNIPIEIQIIQKS